jgi:hypothetical protein
MEDLGYYPSMYFCNKRSIKRYVEGVEGVEFHNLLKLIREGYMERGEEP